MRKTISPEKPIAVRVTDVDFLRKDLSEGVQVEVEPETTDSGLRRMVVSHPDGTVYELESEDSLD